MSAPSNPNGPTRDDDEVALAVVVPCHDVGGTLAQQLERLVDERWDRPWALLVVDNVSTDDTASVAARYEGRGVRVVSATERAGVAYARNVGARALRARAVAFCDGDDVIAPGWVAAMGDALDRHELVGGRLETRSLNPPWLAGARPVPGGDGLGRFAETPFASGCTCGIRTDLLQRLGGFDEGFDGLEDIELSLRAAAAGVEAQLAPGALIAYRLRSSARDVWRQATFYGRGHPLLILRARELGLSSPSRLRGLRSWAWLVLHLPGLLTRQGRCAWIWVLGFRLGVLRRALELRSLFV